MTTTSRTSTSTEALREQLEPVRGALLDTARAHAAALIDHVRVEAETILTDAAASVDSEVDRAEERARQTARARSEQHLHRARADAQQHLLRTRAVIVARLVDATHRAAQDLRDDPRYCDLLDHFERLARDQLGPDAEIERDPDIVGGIVAHCGSRRVDYSLAALADRALDQLGDEIERMSS